jgi:hypothetical protein
LAGEVLTAASAFTYYHCLKHLCTIALLNGFIMVYPSRINEIAELYVGHILRKIVTGNAEDNEYLKSAYRKRVHSELQKEREVNGVKSSLWQDLYGKHEGEPDPNADFSVYDVAGKDPNLVRENLENLLMKSRDDFEKIASTIQAVSDVTKRAQAATPYDFTKATTPSAKSDASSTLRLSSPSAPPAPEAPQSTSTAPAKDGSISIIPTERKNSSGNYIWELTFKNKEGKPVTKFEVVSGRPGYDDPKAPRNLPGKSSLPAGTYTFDLSSINPFIYDKEVTIKKKGDEQFGGVWFALNPIKGDMFGRSGFGGHVDPEWEKTEQAKPLTSEEEKEKGTQGCLAFKDRADWERFVAFARENNITSLTMT